MLIQGLLRSMGMQNVVKLCLSTCEEGLNRAEEATKTLGVPIRYEESDLIISVGHAFRNAIHPIPDVDEVILSSFKVI